MSRKVAVHPLTLVVLCVVTIKYAISTDYHTQRYESIDPETFSLFTEKWLSHHRMWTHIDQNVDYCTETTSSELDSTYTVSYPVCVDGYALSNSDDRNNGNGQTGLDGILRDAPCPNVQCLRQATENTSYTPSDTIDYLPPVYDSSLDSKMICNSSVSVDAHVMPDVYGFNLGVPPEYLPVVAVKLSISGHVYAQFEGQRKTVPNAKIVAWQVDPTALNEFHIKTTESGSGKYTDIGGDAQGNSSAFRDSLRSLSCTGVQHTSASGNYSFTTTIPPSYGPPRHISVSISAPGYHTLVTRVYFDVDWRLQQLTTLEGDLTSPYLSRIFEDDPSFDSEEYLQGPRFPGAIAKDPRIAKLRYKTYVNTSNYVPGTVTGEFETVYDFVLSPLRRSRAEDQDAVPPQDISGLWTDNNGGLISVQANGNTFVASEYPHARVWGTVMGSLIGDTVRGINFKQIGARTSEQIVNAFVPTAELVAQYQFSAMGVGIDNILLSDVTTGIILPNDPFKSDQYSTTNSLSGSIRWTGGGYTALWSKYTDNADTSYRYLKLHIKRETGGYEGGVLKINEIQFFEGLLSHEEKPSADFKMKTPRNPEPQMVTCSSYQDQFTHCWKAFDGDTSGASQWVTKPVGSNRNALSVPQWVTFDFGPGIGRGMRPTAMKIVCGVDGSESDDFQPSGCPKTFALMGSHDNIQFDVLYKKDFYDYDNEYGDNGEMFHFVFDTALGRLNGQRCGSCDSGPRFQCNFESFDGSCSSKYCSASGRCAAAPKCPVGEYMKFAFAGFDNPAFYCEQCPPGRFGDEAGLVSSACSGVCEEGHYCPAGSTSSRARQCGDISVFCPVGSSKPVPAAAGRLTVSAVLSNSSVDDSINGLVQSSEELCPPGSYCVGGVAHLCPVGTYGSSSGLKTSLCTGQCRAGQYCPAGSVVPTICPKGNYCQDGKVKTLCPVGTYGSIMGLKDRSCSGLCVPGYYCPLGSTSEMSVPCPAGVYGAVFGLTSSFCSGPCPAGFYCPAATSVAKGRGCGKAAFYCPESSPLPRRVSEGYYSIGGIAIQGSDGRTINATANETLSENATAQRICEPGFYCSRGIKRACPAGSFGSTSGLIANEFFHPITFNATVYTEAPIGSPTAKPSTYSPSRKPSSFSPTNAPIPPSATPTYRPTEDPAYVAVPTFSPTYLPSSMPSRSPSTQPTRAPSVQPTSQPTKVPSSQPSMQPSVRPSALPSSMPSAAPTTEFNFTDAENPTFYPTSRPSRTPSAFIRTTSRPSYAPTKLSDWRIPFTCSGLCLPGYYCPVSSTTSMQLPCPAGRYGNASGLTSADCTGTCTLGHYCPAGSVVPIKCPAGRYGNSTGLTDSGCSKKDCTKDGCVASICPAGYYCPEGTVEATSHVCGGHNYYCPLGSSVPTPVSEGYYTIHSADGTGLTMSSQALCEEGYYCSGGVKYECPAGTFGDRRGLSFDTCSGLCPIGHYCPSGTAISNMYRCPAGRYGAVEGAKNRMCSGPCREGYHCDEGSPSATQYECGVIAILTDAVSKDAAVGDFAPTFTYPTRTDATAYLSDFNTTTELIIGTSDIQVKIINPNNYYCPIGSAYPIQVLPGYFSTGGNATTRTYQSPCTIGTYCIDGVVSSCPAGTFGRSAKLRTPNCSGLCSKGHYCPAGSISSTQNRCPIGTYGSEYGLGSAACSGSCVNSLECPEATTVAPVAS